MSIPHVPSPLSPCDRISAQVHLAVDRELGPAEEALVEGHLLACPRCQALAANLERMSSVLKAWDEQANDHRAPALRLRNAVLARVAEQSATRRREDRIAGLIQRATAASVLLAVGLGVLLGLRHAARPAPREPQRVATTAAPWPAEAVLAQAVAFPERLPAGTLAHVRLDAGREAPQVPASTAPLPADWDRRAVLDEDSVRRLAFLVARARDLDAFAATLGAPAARVYVPDRMPRLVTLTAYRYLQEKGILDEWSRATTPVTPTVEPGAVPASVRRDTGLTARGMLAPLLLAPEGTGDGGPRGERARLSGVRAPDGRGSVLDAWGLAPAPTGTPRLHSAPLGTSPLGAFLDPVAAQAAGTLRLVDSPSGAHLVVALVKGTTAPIFLPAGQILEGGVADRVLAEPTWLPPSQEERPFVLPCRVVENHPDEAAQDGPRVTEWIAGPTIRALLAAGASQDEVKRAALQQVTAGWSDPASMEFWGEWSLLQVYGGGAARKNLDAIRAQARRWKDQPGFVVTDAAGRFVGFEIVRLRGAAAHELLARLWLGYVTEALLGARDAFAPAGGLLERVLDLLAADERHFESAGSRDPRDEARVSMLRALGAGVDLHALQVGEQAAVVSGLARATR